MVMGLEEEEEETFLVKVCTGWRVTIPLPGRERLGLKRGGLVRVTVRKESAEG